MAIQQVAPDIKERLEKRLVHLSEKIEDDEIPPSDAAKQECVEKLVAAAAGMPGDRGCPLPHLSTSGEGDLLCE